MRYYQMKNGARFFWPGNAAQLGSYCLKCTWLVVYNIRVQRFAVMWPLATVNDVEEEHADLLPLDASIQRAHQQALGLLFFMVLLAVTVTAVSVAFLT